MTQKFDFLVQGMPMQRSMSMERAPNPGYDPRLMAYRNPQAMMVRPPGGPVSMPPGGPNMMGQPPRRRPSLYGAFGPRGMHPPPNMPYQPGKMRNPYMTLQPGGDFVGFCSFFLSHVREE